MNVFDDPAKFERLLDRAAQIERQRIINKPIASVMDYTAKPQPKTQAKQSAVARWKAAIAKGVESGLPKAKAVMQADRQNPGLREAMLKEVNAR